MARWRTVVRSEDDQRGSLGVRQLLQAAPVEALKTTLRWDLGVAEPLRAQLEAALGVVLRE